MRSNTDLIRVVPRNLPCLSSEWLKPSETWFVACVAGVLGNGEIDAVCLAPT